MAALRTQVPRLSRVAAVFVALSLTASCGARWSDEERAEVHARGRAPAGRTDPGATATTQPAGAATAPDEVLGAGSTPGATEPAGVSGPDDGAPPCAVPSSAPGVSADTITLGAINSLSGVVPGLGGTYQAATQAYVAYRNSTGGICGRRLRLLVADDGSEGTRYRQSLLEFDRSAIGVVTGIAVGGDGGAVEAEERGIPMTGTPITPELFDSPVVFGVRPAFADYDAPSSRYTYLREHGVGKAAIVFLNAAVTPAEAAKHRRLIEAAGIEVVLYRALPISTLSYDSTARSIANSGADYVLAFLEQGGSAGLARAIRDIKLPLVGQEYPAAYGSRFAELAGQAAEGASSWIDVLPVEDGGANAEQAELLRWMARTQPNQHIDVFASLAWAATKAFVDTLAALPGPISRSAVLAQLRSTHSYDAGGMLGRIDLGSHRNGGCLIGMVYRGGAWRRMVPSQGFLC